MYKCLIACLLAVTAMPLLAFRDGNESGESARHNLYEYNLYDRNYDRLRGRGIYRNQDRAYPSDRYYPKPHSNGSQDSWIDWSED